MSTIYEGFVAKIATKSGTGRKGPWTLYSGKIEKADGTEYKDWVSFGFDAPKFKEGDYVRFDTFEENGRIKLIPGSGSKPKNPPTRKARQASSSSGGGFRRGYGGGGQYQRGKSPEEERRIVTQHSQKVAVEFIDVLLKNSALPLTSASTKAAEAKRNQELEAAVLNYTKFFVDQVLPPVAAATTPAAEASAEADEVGEQEEVETQQAEIAEEQETDDDRF